MLSTIQPARAGTTAPALGDGEWVVERQRSEIGFTVQLLGGMQTVRGVFHGFRGRIGMRHGDGAGALRIEAESLDTGNARRDRHLCSPAFFDVDRHPQIVATVTGVAPRDGGLTLTGELAIGASRLPLTFPVTVERASQGARCLAGMQAVSCRDAGMSWVAPGLICDRAVLHARLTLDRIPT